MLNVTMSDITRFWKHVDRTADCWVWTGHRVPFGYGHFGLHGSTVNAHRVAWVIAYDQIPEGKHVLHRCDNPPCVRPSHLFIGTDADNVADREAKGRRVTVHGSASGKSKLNEAQVAEMKARYATGAVTLVQLAAEYGVTNALVSQIVRGRIWKHVGGDVHLGYARGERMHHSALTDAKVREMRARRANGARLTELAADYGCSTATVSLIANGKIWKHVSASPPESFR